MLKLSNLLINLLCGTVWVHTESINQHKVQQFDRMLNRNGIASNKLYYYHKLFVFVNVTVEIIRVMKPIMSVKHYKRYNKIIS